MVLPQRVVRLSHIVEGGGLSRLVIFLTADGQRLGIVHQRLPLLSQLVACPACVVQVKIAVFIVTLLTLHREHLREVPTRLLECFQPLTDHTQVLECDGFCPLVPFRATQRQRQRMVFSRLRIQRDCLTGQSHLLEGDALSVAIFDLLSDEKRLFIEAQRGLSLLQQVVGLPHIVQGVGFSLTISHLPTDGQRLLRASEGLQRLSLHVVGPAHVVQGVGFSAEVPQLVLDEPRLFKDRQGSRERTRDPQLYGLLNQTLHFSATGVFN